MLFIDNYNLSSSPLIFKENLPGEIELMGRGNSQKEDSLPVLFFVDSQEI